MIKERHSHRRGSGVNTIQPESREKPGRVRIIRIQGDVLRPSWVGLVVIVKEETLGHCE